MHGYATDIRSHHFALACMKACAHMQAKPLYGTGYRLRTTNRPSRAIERRQYTVAGALDGAAVEPANLSLRELVVHGQCLGPFPVAQFRRSLRRPNDIGEKHSG